MNKSLLVAAGLMVLALSAQAAEPLPGEACSAANNLQFTSGPEVAGGGGHVLLCQGGTWKSILSFNTAASVTKFGNLTCTTGQILKFNGTSWTCAADNGGTLPGLSSTQIWVGNASNAAAAVAMSGDATLSNAGVLTIANNAVGSAEITDGTIANSDLAGSIALAKLAVTGTANSSVYLRGDGTWAAPPSGADNLGNHTATQALAMGNYDVTGVRQIVGGFGVLSTAGTLDWNDASNARSGNGTTLLLGTASNGPGPGTYFFPFSFEYGAMNGTGNFTQLAVPYGYGPHLESGLFIRGRYTGTWSSWRKILTENSSGNIAVSGSLSAASLSGSGASLTSLNASSLATGTVPAARLGSGTANSSVFLRGDGTWAAPPSGADNLGNHTATTSLTMANNAIVNAGQISTGPWNATYDIWYQGGPNGASGGARNLAILGTDNDSGDTLYVNHGSEYSGGTVIGGPVSFSSTLTGNGSGLTNLNASNLAVGTVVAARLGTGTANSTTYLRGDGVWAAVPSGADNLGNHTVTQTLALGANAITSSNGTVIDGGGGWHRTYGNTGWYNGTHGGGWTMEDSTWLRAYGGKGVYTSNVVRADSGVRTNQVCDVNGGNCIAQGALGGSGGGVTAAANASCSVTATGNATCSATCPAGYFAASGVVVASGEKYPCMGSTSGTANGDCWFSSDSAVSIQNPGWGMIARTLHVRCLK